MLLIRHESEVAGPAPVLALVPAQPAVPAAAPVPTQPAAPAAGASGAAHHKGSRQLCTLLISNRTAHSKPGCGTALFYLLSQRMCF